MVHTGVNCLELLLLVVVRLFVKDMPSVFFVGRFGWTSLLNLFGLWSAEDTEGCEESWALWVSMRVLSLRSASPLELSCILTVHASLCCISLCMSQVGANGSKTALHYDKDSINYLYVIRGRKKVVPLIVAQWA